MHRLRAANAGRCSRSAGSASPWRRSAAVLPLVPTVPFLLVAVWAFARSSRRFHDWIYGHRLFGPPLQAWYRYRVISPRAKALATAAMALSLVYVIVIAKAPWWAILAMATVLSAIAGYILSRRSRPPRSARGSAGRARMRGTLAAPRSRIATPPRIA